MTVPFAHLHIHTHYSPQDGVVLVDRMLARAKEMGQSAMAITDHGVMYGAIDFYTTALKMNMKPIIGFEAYVAPGSRKDKPAPGSRGYNHLTLLARNFEGYQNLCALCSEGFLSGFYRHPRIDWELLLEHSAGLACLSGCLNGKIPELLLSGKMSEAEHTALKYQELLGKGNYFIEIMNNGLPNQKALLPLFRELSDKTGIPLVATADSHYLYPEDKALQDIKICIVTGKKLEDENRMHAGEGEYLKSADEMLASLPGFEDAVENTMRVVDICDLQLPIRKGFHLPKLTPPEGKTSLEWMKEISINGLKKHYGEPLPTQVIERFDKECAVIAKMGFPDYFIIVWDVVKFARDNGIPVGPGRGSAAGSIVAYGMGITDLDPLKYDLFFERFLNEGRNEMPDIDLDFDKERRHEVVEHIIAKHGADHCANIITFGCLSLKSGIKDVGRVMGVPIDATNRLSNFIPKLFKVEKGKTPLQQALETIPEFKDAYDSDPQTKDLLDKVDRLEGVMRQTGIHAAGVLVCDKQITQYLPLAVGKGDIVSTQCEMKGLEEFGLCKIDVLGLETLSLIKNAVEIIKKCRGIDVDIAHVPLDDKPTFEMLSRGDSKGVFQFESDGFRNLLFRLKPDVFEDLIAAVAIFRPGPLQFLDSFINRKHGIEKITYLHPKMEPILRQTYGLILYQEQVQDLAKNLAHFTLSEGDLMRRAMGKKKKEIMDEYKAKFIRQSGVLPTRDDGTADPAFGKQDIVPEEVAKEIYDQIEKFAGYGFNKSHSACYAFIAYQTAWLKCHFPCEYMAALLTTNKGDSEKIVLYSKDAADMGMKLFPADVNASGAAFTPENGSIRFGLSAIKGVGTGAAELIEAERLAAGPYKDLFDFCARVDLRAVNKGAIDALIKAGAMDCFGQFRSRMCEGLDMAMRVAAQEQKSKAAGQMGLFGALPADNTAHSPLPQIDEWQLQEKLRLEKSVLGFYLSSHPLAKFASRLKAFATASLSDLQNYSHNAQAIVGGLVTGFTVKIFKSKIPDKGGKISDKTSKKKEKEQSYQIGTLILEDEETSLSMMVPDKKLDEFKPLLVPDSMVFVEVLVDRSRDRISLKVINVIPFDKAEEELTLQTLVTVPATELTEEKLTKLRKIAGRNPGRSSLCFRVGMPEGYVELRAGDQFVVSPTPGLIQDVNSLFGAGSVTLIGRRVASA